jgi:hypothetical protein
VWHEPEPTRFAVWVRDSASVIEENDGSMDVVSQPNRPGDFSGHAASNAAITGARGAAPSAM